MKNKFYIKLKIIILFIYCLRGNFVDPILYLKDMHILCIKYQIYLISFQEARFKTSLIFYFTFK